MLGRGLSIVTLALCLWAAGVLPMSAGEPLQKCSIGGQTGPACATQERRSDPPTCGIEMTCTDRPIQLGYTDGVCFRATCPGVWALTHKRIDQVSFRRRYIASRHYSFVGTWELKDQGVVQSVAVPIRELFLVLPDDLIELKLRDPDCNTAVEVQNLGYIKKGTLDELKRWLAYTTYLERPQTRDLAGRQGNGPLKHAATCPDPFERFTGGILSGIFSLGRTVGLPCCQ